MKYFSKLKLNAKGFAHVELVMIVATIAVIGGIGSYVMLKRSHADTISVGASTCGSGYTLFTTVQLYYTNHSTAPAKLKVYQYINNTTHVYKRCGLLVATGSAFGVAKPMNLEGYDNGTYKKDDGTYKYYAGPMLFKMGESNDIGYYNASMKFNGKWAYATHGW